MTGCCYMESIPGWMTPEMSSWLTSTMDPCACCCDYPSSSTSDCVPEFSSHEENGKFHIRAEMPCFDKEHIVVSASGGMVTIKGSTGEMCEDYGGPSSVRECHTGHFERSLCLPEDADSDTVDASFKDGVLDIAIGHSKGTGSKKVHIG